MSICALCRNPYALESTPHMHISSVFPAAPAGCGIALVVLTTSLLLFAGCVQQADPDTTDSPTDEATPVLHSSLEIIDIETGERDVVLTLPAHFEAPNWSPRRDVFPVQLRRQNIPAAGGRGRARAGRRRIRRAIQ